MCVDMIVINPLNSLHKALCTCSLLHIVHTHTHADTQLCTVYTYRQLWLLCFWFKACYCLLQICSEHFRLWDLESFKPCLTLYVVLLTSKPFVIALKCMVTRCIQIQVKPWYCVEIYSVIRFCWTLKVSTRTVEANSPALCTRYSKIRIH